MDMECLHVTGVVIGGLILICVLGAIIINVDVIRREFNKGSTAYVDSEDSQSSDTVANNIVINNVEVNVTNNTNVYTETVNINTIQRSDSEEYKWIPEIVSGLICTAITSIVAFGISLWKKHKRASKEKSVVIPNVPII